jgi:hypothetical protein
MARFTQSFLLVGLLSLGVPGCSSEGNPTSTAAPNSGTVDELETELAEAQQELASAQGDVEALEETVVQLQTDLDRAREQAREATAASAQAIEILDSIVALLQYASSELCPTDAPALPADLASELVDWLADTESSVPAGIEATLSGGVTALGWWLFTAEFDRRFQPGIFVRSPDGDFTVAWGGIGSPEIAIRAWVYNAEPSMPAELALCIDVKAFVEP